MSCNSCGRQRCRDLACNKRAEKSCAVRHNVGWVPGSACTLFVELDGITRTVDMSQVFACEPVTHMRWNTDKCRLEYLNEEYVRSNGTSGFIETVDAKTIAACIKLKDLADVADTDPENCDLLVYKKDPNCGPGCAGIADMWQPYTIPDAGDCEIEQTEDGFYKVLIKTEDGCIRECKLPIVPNDNTIIAAVRDSLPDDPDFPWYYGLYNEDAIPLKLAEIAPEYFGKYTLEVEINYGIQVVRPSAGKNMNFRSLVIPYAEGETPDYLLNSYILQDDVTSELEDENGTGAVMRIPWGTKSMRNSITMIVPKGKEAFLRHEFRFRSFESFAASPDHYEHNPLDGQRVPDEIAGFVNQMEHNASRMNALHISIRPSRGKYMNKTNLTPARETLDAPVDIAPQLQVPA